MVCTTSPFMLTVLIIYFLKIIQNAQLPFDRESYKMNRDDPMTIESPKPANAT